MNVLPMENIRSLCRLCLDSSSGLNLFHGSNEPSYAKKIQSMLGIDLEEDPNWPSNACSYCTDFLEVLELFRRQISTSQQTLFDQIYKQPETSEPMTETINPQDTNIPKDPCPNTSATSQSPMEDEKSFAVDSESLESIALLPLLPRPAVSEVFEIHTEITEDGLLPETDYFSDIIEFDEEEDLQLKVSDNSEPKTLQPPLRQSKLPAKQNSNSRVRQTVAPTEEERQLEAFMIDMKLLHCNVCDQDCKTYFGLRAHVRNKHDVREYKICCDMKINFILPTPLYDHIRFHLNKDAFQCKECGRRFGNSINLDQHKKRVHTISNREFMCEYCGVAYGDRTNYEVHLLKHTGIRFKCNYCDKDFSQRSSLLSHTELIHELKVKFLCELCGRGFPSIGLLNTHIMDHGGPHGGRRRKVPKVKIDNSQPNCFDGDYFKS